MVVKWLRVTLLAGLLLTTMLAAYAWQWLHSPLSVAEHLSESSELTLELQAGDSLARVVYRLQRQGFLKHPRLLIAYARLTRLTNVKLGEYALPLPLSPEALLQALVAGKVKQRSITLVEGITFREAVALLRAQPHLQKHLVGLSVTQIARKLDLTEVNPEGWLFPDTFFYTKQMSDWALLQQSHARMQDVLASEWPQRDAGLPYKTAYEALIMASIIEKETAAPHERAEISGVFVRRLKKGMRLQTDPTVIYGMGESYAGNIRRRHLKQKTPYNTYMINGLPPTPIALPGREAIHAALHPAQGDSLYFVARGDGTHYFSTTLAEHTRAVRQFQLRRVNGYRSVPQ